MGINGMYTNKTNDKLFKSKSYKNLTRILILIYILFMLVYVFRENLYELDNKYITLFAETAPNLIPSFLFTLIGIFYAVPFFKGMDSIKKPAFILIVNTLNITIFALIEYMHVVYKSGAWDNNDIVASLIGIIFSTVFYYMSRKYFI
jgi:TRAP-type uncharacterized transport system fused permease subunit